jgi:hypothetical protein
MSVRFDLTDEELAISEKKSAAEVKAFLKRIIRDKPKYDDLSAADQAFFRTIVKKYNAWAEKQIN